MEALIEEERLANAQESADNQDIYAKHAEKLEKKKKKEESRKGLLKKVYLNALKLCCCKDEDEKKVLPIDDDGNVLDEPSIDEETVLTADRVDKEEEAIVDPENWPNLPPPFIWYIYAAHACYKEITYGSFFNNMVTVVIIVAGINVGIQTYPGMDEDPNVAVLDMLILTIFTIEILVKLVACGFRPWTFFIGRDWRWNNFDLAIVLLSFPIWGLEGGGSIALLRLVRLARLTKLINKVPALATIVWAGVKGLQNCFYIMLLCLLVFYLYGVCGFYLFSANDPFHFGTLPLALITLFRCSTLENWGDIMFLNLFGCDVYTDMYVGPEDETPDNSVLWCRYPGTSYVLGSIYFISFIIIAALVMMMSLFVGVVSMAMTESLIELNERRLEAKKQAAAEASLKRMERMMSNQVGAMKRRESRAKRITAKGDSPDGKGEDGKNGDQQDSPSAKTDTVVAIPSMRSSEDEYDSEDDDPDAPDDYDSVYGLKRLAKKYPLFKYWYWYKISNIRKSEDEANEVQERIKMALLVAVGNVNGDTNSFKESESMKAKKDALLTKYGKVGQVYIQLADFMRSITESNWFSNFMTGVIIMASVNVGIQSERRIMAYDTATEILETCDFIILMIFTIEVVFKIIAEGFHPFRYFKDNWNVFDFLIVVASYIPQLGSSVTMLRLLRLLRVLKLVKQLPKLKAIINALMNSMESIAYVGLVLILIFYVFAIIGMLLFSANDPWHFGSLHMAFLSLFQAATLDDWTITMYISQYGCDKYGGVYEDFPEQCDAPYEWGLIAVMYWLLFIVIGSQVLLTLFIGVISTSMEEQKEAARKDKDLEDKVERTAKKLMLTEERVEAMRFVFNELDMDNGGTIEEEELKLGLDAINAKLSEKEIIDILQKVSPDGNSVDFHGFILFMYETPMFSKASALSKITNAFATTSENADQRRKREKSWLYQCLIDIVYFGGTSNRVHYQEMEAALLIQDIWRERKERVAARTAARGKIDKDVAAEQARRRAINDSLR